MANDHPSLAEFETWEPEAVARLVQNKIVLYAPGGTSRWYFLTYKEERQGYDKAEQFEQYSRRALDRIVEQCGFMCQDGVGTVLVVAHMIAEQTRDEKYNQNLALGYHLMVDEQAQAVYEKHGLHVQFRGEWRSALERLGAAGVYERFGEVEQKTGHRASRLIWLAPDTSVIPQGLAPMIGEHIQRTGQIPERAALCQAYYGSPETHVDIFLSNNKPSIKNMSAPLLTLGDLYFTMAPSLFMGQRQWRHVLYDHMFTRQTYFRDYKKVSPTALDDLQVFYAAHRDSIMGEGIFHEPTQTWRPALSDQL